MGYGRKKKRARHMMWLRAMTEKLFVYLLIKKKNTGIIPQKSHRTTGGTVTPAMILAMAAMENSVQ